MSSKYTYNENFKKFPGCSYLMIIRQFLCITVLAIFWMFFIMEIWKTIPGFKDYEASNFGKVKSKDRYVFHSQIGKIILRKGKILSSHKNIKSGYLSLVLYKKKKRKTYLVHRLIGITFLPNLFYKQFQINHKNGIKIDNRVENLEWVTQSENMKHAFKTGLEIHNHKSINNGENHPMHKLTEDQVEEIRKNYKSHNRSGINQYSKNIISYIEIAQKYNVGPNAISDILNYKTWGNKNE